jgi:hypothetical protein
MVTFITPTMFQELCVSGDILTEYVNYDFHTVAYMKFGKYNDSALQLFYRKTTAFDNPNMYDITTTLLSCGVPINSTNKNGHNALYTLLSKSSGNYNSVVVSCVNEIIDNDIEINSEAIMCHILKEENHNNESTHKLIQTLCAHDYELNESDIQYAFKVIDDDSLIIENMSLSRDSIEGVEIEITPSIIDFLATLE